MPQTAGKLPLLPPVATPASSLAIVLLWPTGHTSRLVPVSTAHVRRPVPTPAVLMVRPLAQAGTFIQVPTASRLSEETASLVASLTASAALEAPLRPKVVGRPAQFPLEIYS